LPLWLAECNRLPLRRHEQSHSRMGGPPIAPRASQIRSPITWNIPWADMGQGARHRAITVIALAPTAAQGDRRDCDVASLVMQTWVPGHQSAGAEANPSKFFHSLFRENGVYEDVREKVSRRGPRGRVRHHPDGRGGRIR